jgi:hypothetical protein
VALAKVHTLTCGASIPAHTFNLRPLPQEVRMRKHWVFLLSAFTTGVVFGYAALPAVGQSSGDTSSALTNISTGDATRDWSYLESEFAKTHGRLIVVRLSAPRKRGGCHVESIDEQGMHCRSLGGTRLIPAQDVEAVISPGDRNETLAFLASFLGLGGGAMAAAAIFGVATLGASIPLWILGVVLVYVGLFGAAMGDNMSERVLYQRPGTNRTFRLH